MKSNFLTLPSRRQILIGAAAASSCACASRGSQISPQTHPLFVDGLSFLPNDPAILAKSGLSAFIADVSGIETIARADGTTSYIRTYAACLQGIADGLSIIATNPETYRLIKTKRDLGAALDEKKAAVVLQFQGAESVESNNDQLETFQRLGLRVLQLTHHYGNKFAGGALDTIETGLTPDGRDLIVRLEEKSILVDLSHASPSTALDVCNVASKPVVHSHGAARAIVPHARCSPDSVIRAIGESGGVFGVFMMSFWLTRNPIPTPLDFIRHIRHVSNTAGIGAVAVSHDFKIRETAISAEQNSEMVQEYLPWWESHRKLGVLGFDAQPEHVMIPEFSGPDRMERIWEALKADRFSSSQIEKIMGGNWLRVLRESLPA